MVGIQRHELDEPDLHTAVPAEAGEIDQLVVVDTSHDHYVDLHGFQSRLEGGVDPVQHTVQVIAQRDLGKAIGPQRVQRHVDPGQPGGGQIGSHPAQGGPVGRHREVHRQHGKHLDETRQISPNSWLAPGESDALHAVTLDQQTSGSRDLLEGEQISAVQPLQPLGRHAVSAAEVTPVGDRYA